MKNQSLPLIITFITLLSYSSFCVGQAPNLGIAANFALFTVTGAIDNTGISLITGNIGSDAGDITGFGVVNGGIHNSNAVTRQCSTDLMAAYDQLNNTTATSTTHTPAFGTGETLFPGVYSIAAAGSIAGTLTLDAQGDHNAVFIFKTGGAFTTAASSTINLINGATACNVFWQAEGAISMAAGTIMKGTLIAHNGAVSMGAGGTLEGRMLSTTGAVSVYGVYAYIGCGFTPLPVKLLSFTGVCDRQEIVLKWSTAAEENSNYFTVESSSKGTDWQTIRTITGHGSSSSLHTYTITAKPFDKEISYYRLKQTDLDGSYKYGNIIAVKTCNDDFFENIKAYPNPSTGKFELLFKDGEPMVHSIEIFNSSGQKLNHPAPVRSKIDLSHYPPGVYFLLAHRGTKTTNLKVVIKK